MGLPLRHLSSIQSGRAAAGVHFRLFVSHPSNRWWTPKLYCCKCIIPETLIKGISLVFVSCTWDLIAHINSKDEPCWRMRAEISCSSSVFTISVRGILLTAHLFGNFTRLFDFSYGLSIRDLRLNPQNPSDFVNLTQTDSDAWIWIFMESRAS